MATDISGKAQAGMDETGRRLTQMIQRTSQKVDDQVAKLSDVETSAKTYVYSNSQLVRILF